MSTPEEANNLAIGDPREELRASHERLRFVLASITDAYFAVGRDWRILDVNPVAEQLIFQMPKEALVGGNLWDVCPQGQASDFHCQYETAFATGQPVHFEAKGCHGQRWFEIHAYPAGDRLDIYGRNITKRKEAEAKLLLTQFTVDRAAEAIFWVDADARIAYANEAACQALGYSCEEIVGLSVPDIDPRFSAATWPEHWERIRQCGKLTFETVHRRKSGETFPVEITANVVQYAGREYHCDFVRDVSERKQSEAAVQRHIHRLKLLKDSAAYLLSAEDPANLVEGLYDRIANSLEVDSLLEYEFEESPAGLRLKTCIGIPEEIRSQIGCLEIGQALCGTVAENRRPLLVSHLQESDNPKAQLLKDLGFQSYVCHPLSLGQKFVGTLAFASRRRAVLEESDREFFQTISHYVALGKERARLLEQLRRHAEALEKLVGERTAKLRETISELEHFSYSLTHDMRAPLRAMHGFAGLVLRDCRESLNAQQCDYLHRIATAAERMDHLVTDALDYSKVVRQEFVLAPVDVAGLLRGIIESYPGFQPPQAEIRLDGAIPRVLGNEAALTQCFSNLLNNAVKFVEPGATPHIRIRAEAREEWVRLWVEDNGIGIPRDFQPTIFDMFVRGSNAYEGTGIGLALVRKATERMGGKVGVESEPGQGSRFWLELKRAR